MTNLHLSHLEACKNEPALAGIAVALQNIKSVKLTNRQSSCALHLLQGLQYKEIALKLNLSPRTVEDHVIQLKIKFNARNKGELIIKLMHLISQTLGGG